MSLNRLEASADLSDPQARGLLHETLELVSNELRRLKEELVAVRESDQRVAPVPIEAFPLPMGPVSAGSDIDLGMVMYRSSTQIPAGFLEANGQAVSRLLYPTYFALVGTTYGAGDGSTTFNLPNLKRRYIMGDGGSSGNGVNNSIGSTGGSETSNALIAHTHTGPSHTHDLSNHTHDMQNHTHSMTHTHTVPGFGPGAGPATATRIAGTNQLAPSTQNATETSGAASSSTTGGSSANTSVPSANVTSAAGTGNTGSAGSGSSFPILPPTIVMYPLVRVTITPQDTEQTIPLAWGPVPGRVNFGLRSQFGQASLFESFATVEDGRAPEGIVTATASSGTTVGTEIVTFTGLTRIPYNFRGFKTKGLRIRTKIDITGAPVASQAVVTLKVFNPIGAGYLGATYSRTVTVSAGTIQDGDFVDAKLTKDELGPDWRAGYPFRFELSFEVPLTHTLLQLSVGALLISW